MWHYLIPTMLAIPVSLLTDSTIRLARLADTPQCYGVWLWCGNNESYGGIAPMELYGLAYLGNLVSIAQPAASPPPSRYLVRVATSLINSATTCRSVAGKL